MQSYGFSPTIDKPTRVYKDSATLIDNILINETNGSVQSGNIVSNQIYFSHKEIISHKRKNKYTLYLAREPNRNHKAY
jgi:hypothetical protein